MIVSEPMTRSATGTTGSHRIAGHKPFNQASSRIIGTNTTIHTRSAVNRSQSNLNKIRTRLPMTKSPAVLIACIGYIPGRVTTTMAMSVLDIQ